MPVTDLPAGVIVSFSQQYRRCGKPGCAACAAGGRGHGPYWYAYWREGGRMRSRYLGKNMPAGAAQGVASTADPAALCADPAALCADPATHSADPAAAPSPGLHGRPPAGQGELRVRTLGAFMVWREAELIPHERWSRRKAADLFKLLLSTPGYRLHREQVIDVLWPEAEPDEGAARLRAVVHLLRRILDGPGTSRTNAVAGPSSAGPSVAVLGRSRPDAPSCLRSEGELLALVPVTGEPPETWLDAAAFAQAAAAALAGRDAQPCRAALGLYGGEYLPDEMYADWAAVRREELRQQHLALLLHLSDLAASAGDAAEAERALRLVLAADPCHEVAAQRLMRLLGDLGRTGDAIRVYQALTTALRDDLDLGPAAETEALHARLRAPAGLASRDPTARAAAAGGDPTARAVPTSGVTNLPAPLSAFVGRAHEQDAVRELLSTYRLVTLTGSGGCGKTRLALEVARGLPSEYADGIWLVDLGTVVVNADTRSVAQAVARAMGVHEEPGRPVLATLVDVLRSRRLLLLMDNCEHVVASCAEILGGLLASCPSLHVLATSREALRVEGEATWRVPSLSLPPSAYAPRLEELPRYEAVQLFVQRARQVRPVFALTDENAATVVRICRRLDGIPLALEIAAARLNTLTIVDLAARLDDCFRVLIGGSRTALPRHQTLLAALDWSYTLLDGAERAMLRRLAVFAGGWTLPAAEAVCADDGVPTGGESAAEAPADGVPADDSDSVPADAVLDLLAQLVRKSLVVLTEADGETRYELLETVRQYARGRLGASDDAAHVARRHCRWCLDLAERAEAARAGPDSAAWLARLDAEHDNLLAALAWSAAQQSGSELSLRLAAAMRWLWEVRGYLGEGRRWLDELLRRSEPVSAVVRARALSAAGGLAYRQGDFAQATFYLQESLELRRSLGDEQGMAFSLNNLALVADEQGDYERAGALYEQSLALKRAAGDRRGVATSLTNLGRVAQHQGDYERAAGLHEQSLILFRELGDQPNAARSLNNLALVAQHQGDYERAAELFGESLALKRELGDNVGIAPTLQSLGHMAYLQGDNAAALTFYRQGLALQRAVGDRLGIAQSLEGIALLCAAGQQLDRAAQLLGTAEALREQIGAPLTPAVQISHAEAVEGLRAGLGAARLATAWARGRTMALDRVFAALVDSMGS